MSGSRVAGLGHYQPDRVLTNTDIARLVDTTDEWIRSRVGIVERRIAAADETVTDMAVAAGAKALAAGGVGGDEIDMVVVATCTAHDRMPNIAGQVARRLDVTAPAICDLNVACAGFCYALATADHAIQAGAAGHALVIGTEKMSDFIDWTDRSTCVIFADGAGAAVLARSSQPGVMPVVWGSVPAAGDAVRLLGDHPFIAQEGQRVYRWATTALAPVALEAIRRGNLEPREIAAVICHQANARIIDRIAAGLGLPSAIVARDVVTSGNTSAASIPIALSKLVEEGDLPPGSPVLLLGFGAGLSYASQVVRVPT